MTATEFRFARVAWSAVVGFGLFYLYMIAAPKYMGFYQPTLLERSEFPAVALTGLIVAALTYLVTRTPRVLSAVAVVASAIAGLVIFAITWGAVRNAIFG